MNALLKMPLDKLPAGLSLENYLYAVLLSDTTTVEEDGCKFVISTRGTEDLYDYFDGNEDEVYKALNALGENDLIQFSEEGGDGGDVIYVGEMRGKKFFPFERSNSIFDNAVELLNKELKRYGNSKSAKDKSRSRFIREKVDVMLEDVTQLRPGDFTELHGYLYEVYTGGEIYNIRNKTEYYQTNNMLKAYDRYTVFALIVEGTLHSDEYRKKGVPTLTNVACMKDDVFGALTRASRGSKEYMRDTEHSMDDDKDF